MSTFHSFKDIEAWKKSRDLTSEIYKLTGQSNFRTDYALRNQCRRACISITSNIAEGFERGGTGEFIQFLSIAKGSTGELKSQLHIALDQAYLSKHLFTKTITTIDEIAKLISGLISYLRNSGLKGIKYRNIEKIKV